MIGPNARSTDAFSGTNVTLKGGFAAGESSINALHFVQSTIL
jgi:hypothetical protein